MHEHSVEKWAFNCVILWSHSTWQLRPNVLYRPRGPYWGLCLRQHDQLTRTSNKPSLWFNTVATLSSPDIWYWYIGVERGEARNDNQILANVGVVRAL